MIFGEISAFISIAEKIKGILKKSHNRDELISTRLINLCNAHGVARYQIPAVLGNSITHDDVKSDESFLRVINEKILNDACFMFGVNRDWLDGASKKVYDSKHFYKSPHKFNNFISELLSSTNVQSLSGILITQLSMCRNTESLLLIQEEVSDGYYRYYFCNGWIFSYWKSRAYLSACIATCWRNDIFLHGVKVKTNYLDKIATGEKLLDFGSAGIDNINGIRWHAVDLTSCPDTYLDGIDPEQGNFGLISALSLWLELEEKGYMNFNNHLFNSRKNFIAKLNNIK